MSKEIVQFALALDFTTRKYIHQSRKGELEEPYKNPLTEVRGGSPYEVPV